MNFIREALAWIGDPAAQARRIAPSVHGAAMSGSSVLYMMRVGARATPTGSAVYLR